jgi:hypothetical protein
MIESLWRQVAPLYEELHCYVHRKLKENYDEIADSTSRFIPAHILGNMWGQSVRNEKCRIYLSSSSESVFFVCPKEVISEVNSK